MAIIRIIIIIFMIDTIIIIVISSSSITQGRRRAGGRLGLQQAGAPPVMAWILYVYMCIYIYTHRYV